METQCGERPRFWGGKNIAMKVPPHQYAATVAFYRDTLGLPLLRQAEDGCGFELGPVGLWIDRVDKR